MEKIVLDGYMFAAMLRGGACFLHANADKVNTLNVFPVPDGDTGDNMSMTMDGGVCVLPENTSDLPLSYVSNTAADGMLHSARGNSGVILSQFFSGIADVFKGCDKADMYTVGKALESGVRAAYASVVTPTEGTILTVAREAVLYATERIRETTTPEALFDDILYEAEQSLARTPTLLKMLQDAGVVDSGGAGFLYIMEGFHKVLKGETIETAEAAAVKSNGKSADFSAFTEHDTLTYGYCTEFFLRLQTSKTDIAHFDVSAFRKDISAFGDSVVCVQNGSLLKLHIHTKEPENVIGYCHAFGEFLTMKIENMTLQHTETKEADEKEEQPKPKTKYAAVAVACGDGFRQVFRDLGVDEIVSGGQTNNPSIQDFLCAFDHVNSETVFVLPNNANSILAARQAASLYRKAQVTVIESKSMGEGYAALSGLNYELENSAEIADAMTEAMRIVRTATVTKAIRDTKMDNIDIHKNDYIGLVGKRIVASDRDIFRVTEKIVSTPEFSDRYVITMFSGKEISPEKQQEMDDFLHANCRHAEIYTVNGGQDIYDYILVAE